MQVLVSVITRDVIHAETVEWLCNQSDPVDIVKTPFSIPHQRNLQVERFLATEKDCLFILDNDVVPQYDTIDRLLKPLPLPPKTCRVAPPWTANRPTDKPYPMAYNLGIDGLWYSSVNTGREYVPVGMGRQFVGGAGMSGSLIPQQLFIEMERPWFVTTHDPNTGFLVETEDFYFWQRAARLGWRLECDYDLVADHIKARYL